MKDIIDKILKNKLALIYSVLLAIFFIIVIIFFNYFFKSKKPIIYSDKLLIEQLIKKNDSLILEKDREILDLVIKIKDIEKQLVKKDLLLNQKDTEISLIKTKLKESKQKIKSLNNEEQETYWKNTFN
jgi:hypothetical protein